MALRGPIPGELTRYHIRTTTFRFMNTKHFYGHNSFILKCSLGTLLECKWIWWTGNASTKFVRLLIFNAQYLRIIIDFGLSKSDMQAHRKMLSRLTLSSELFACFVVSPHDVHGFQLPNLERKYSFHASLDISLSADIYHRLSIHDTPEGMARKGGTVHLLRSLAKTKVSFQRGDGFEWSH